MKTTLSASFVAVSALVLSSSFADRWDGYNTPEKMSRGRYTYDFSTLDKKQQAELSNQKLPWPETYWPTFKGGIAYRWQSKAPGATWSYRLYSKNELLGMSAEERTKVVAEMSPAEKFDLLQGDYSYPTVQRERSRTSPRAASWEGLCHGWAPAAMNHREPTPKTFVNSDGIEIPFGSSDIKGLVTYYYGKVDWKPVGWTNRRCRTKIGGKGCRGVNAGTLHLVLTNQIGLLDEAFVMDRDRKIQLWNQPFFGYSYSKVGSCKPSRSARRAGAKYGVAITMKAKWVDEIDHSEWDPSMKVNPETGLLETRFKTNTYRYCLEISGSGKIVGGEWLSKDRPGFIWDHEVTDFAHPYYGRIKELLND